MCRIACKGVFLGNVLRLVPMSGFYIPKKSVSLLNIRFTRLYGCVGVGHPSSSVVIGIEEDRVKDISFPGHISGLPRGWRSAVRRVAILRAIRRGRGVVHLVGNGRRVLMANVEIWWLLV